jgi:hypothetical protein
MSTNFSLSNDSEISSLELFHSLSIWERVGVRVYGAAVHLRSKPALAGDRIISRVRSLQSEEAETKIKPLPGTVAF